MADDLLSEKLQIHKPEHRKSSEDVTTKLE